MNPAIGVGQYVTRTNTFTLPIEPSGDYYLILKVDAFGFVDAGAVQESNESNNVAVTQIHILNPDLVPMSLTAPAVAATDQGIPLQWSELNQGDGVAANGWLDCVSLSTKPQLDSSANALTCQFTTNTLAPGESVTNSWTAYVRGVPQGNYYLLLSIDNGNYLPEINETNNVLARPIQIVNPDLVPAALSAPCGCRRPCHYSSKLDGGQPGRRPCQPRLGRCAVYLQQTGLGQHRHPVGLFRAEQCGPCRKQTTP